MIFDIFLSESLSFWNYLSRFKKLDWTTELKKKYKSREFERRIFNSKIEDMDVVFGTKNKFSVFNHEFKKEFQLAALENAKKILKKNLDLIKDKWLNEIFSYWDVKPFERFNIVIADPFSEKGYGSANMEDKIVLEPRSLKVYSEESAQKDVFVIFHELLHKIIRKSLKFKRIDGDIQKEEAVIEAITNYYMYPDGSMLDKKMTIAQGASLEILRLAKHIFDRFKGKWLDGFDG